MRNAIAGALLALAASASSAQEIEPRTVDVYHQEQSSEGRLDACMLVFTALVRDFATQRGTLLIVNGSMAIRRAGADEFFFTGKLGTRPYGTPDKWQEPHHFHFATATGSTAGIGKIAESDTPGYKLLITPLSQPLQKFLQEMGDAGEFKVGFNRRAGGMDVTTPVKLNVSLRRGPDGVPRFVESEDAPREFYACLVKLLK